MAVEYVSDAIVEAVLRDLMGRRGIKVPLIELEADDPETFAEMKRDLVEIVERILPGKS